MQRETGTEPTVPVPPQPAVTDTAPPAVMGPHGIELSLSELGKTKAETPKAVCVKFHLMTIATNANAACKLHFGEQPVLCYLLVRSLAKGMLACQQGSTYKKGNKNCYLDNADLSSSPSVCNVILSPPFPRDFLKRHVCKQSTVILIGMRLHHNLMER